MLEVIFGGKAIGEGKEQMSARGTASEWGPPYPLKNVLCSCLSYSLISERVSTAYYIIDKCLSFLPSDF